MLERKLTKADVSGYGKGYHKKLSHCDKKTKKTKTKKKGPLKSSGLPNQDALTLSKFK